MAGRRPEKTTAGQHQINKVYRSPPKKNPAPTPEQGGEGPLIETCAINWSKRFYLTYPCVLQDLVFRS